MLKFPRAAGMKWYDIKAAATAPDAPTVTDIWIYDVIGDDWFDPSLTAKELCQTIAAIDTDEIVLHFNSPGGSVSDGTAIYNALITHTAKVSSVIEGWIGSIATILALAADPGCITMFDNVMWMIHQPWTCCCGNEDDMRQSADYLHQVGQLMSRVYMGRCTKTEEELQAALKAETYLTAEQAVEWGFVDEAIPALAAAALAPTPAVLEALGFKSAPAVGVEDAPSAEAIKAQLDRACEQIAEIQAKLNEAPPPVTAASGDSASTLETKRSAALIARSLM